MSLLEGGRLKKSDFALRHVCCLELRGGSRCANLEQELDNNTKRIESAERNSIERDNASYIRIRCQIDASY